MVVSAYASLISLTHVLDNLHYRAQFSNPPADIKQIETLQKYVNFLLEFVELHSESRRPDIEDLWRLIAEAAFEVEDTINFNVVQQLHMKYQGQASDRDFLIFCEDMEGMIQKIRFIFEEELPVIEEEEKGVQAGKQPGASVPAGDSSTASLSSMDVVVGLDEHVATIIRLLTTGTSNLQILPIVGMGGIGKTTLAEAVFDDLFIEYHFHIRIWLTISQNFDTRRILKSVRVEGENEGLYESNEGLYESNEGSYESLVQLGILLYRKLFGKRYLIVLDDMWTTEYWDELKIFFPNNKMGSRIMFTTRLLNMAASLGSYSPYQLTHLGMDESRYLFCQNAFGQDICPHANLEKFAKLIVQNCRGLPLVIVVLGRSLATSNMSLESWKFVAENISSFSNLGDDEHCLEVLSLSYKILPIHLKPCFLYMRVFPKDASIQVSHLINLWIAEGFIKQVNDKSLEDIGHEYIKDLIDRNLILNKSPRRYGLQDKEMCGIHDLLQELCFRESMHEMFIQSPKVQRCSIAKDTCFLCMKQIQDTSVLSILNLASIDRSLQDITPPGACDACKRMYSYIIRWVTVKTFVVREMDHHISPHVRRDEICQPTEVRFASIHSTGVLDFVSPKLHLLWNLQSIIFHSKYPFTIVLPGVIWGMPQLRHVLIDNVLLPDPVATNIDGENLHVLKNLQTLSRVTNFMFTKKILKLIPNLRKLECRYRYGLKMGELTESKKHFPSDLTDLTDLSPLQKLESLKVHEFVLREITFPSTLKKLTLYKGILAWHDMSILGSLLNLEILKLHANTEGSEWNPNEGEFLRLKQLDFASFSLVCWRADKIHFPNLEHLVLKRLKSLGEIPSGIGNIQTLQSIALVACSDSAINSAKKIREEQRNIGHEIRIVVDNFN